jgi:quinol monooxygenase YgiN
MTRVAIVAKLTAATGRRDELKSVVADLVAGVADTEPGTLVYAAAQDNDDPDVFWFYEYYGTEDAAAAHSGGTALAEAGTRMRGMLAGRPEVHRLTPVAGKGLPA